MTQTSFTSLVPVKAGQAAPLTAFLNAIGTHIKDNPHIRLAEDFPMVHFARWVVLPGPNGDDQGASLIFGTDHDGDTSALIRRLVEKAGPAVARIYSYCEGAPADIEANPDAFAAYLQRHEVPFAARHIAYRGHTVASVRSDITLREKIESFLDDALARGELNGCPPDNVRDKIRAFVQREQAADPSLSTTPTPPRTEWELPAILAGLGLALILLFVLARPVFWALVGLTALFVVTLYVKERLDAARQSASPPLIPPDELRDLLAREDHQVQNQMTHVVPVKPGLFRQFTLRFVLWGINLAAAYYWNKGQLGTIPTIHFARWMLLDNGRRLLFFSNFDGSWENYLGDFVDKASVGLTGVWSNTVGFPRSFLLFWEGARDIEPFKAWTRAHQIPTQVWYSAHPDHTVVNILNAIAIRDGIEPTLDAAQTRAWLRRF